LVIDAGELPYNPPSTVIDTTLEQAVIHRQGRVVVSSELATLVSETETATVAAGGKLITDYAKLTDKNCVVILLEGPLGAGKTHFVKGIAKGLGLTQTIVSPSYVYMLEYPLTNGKMFYHLDPWRVTEAVDMEMLFPGEMFKPGNVIAVEWAGKAYELIQRLAKQNSVIFHVEIKYAGEKRTIKIGKI
jgi:tRNA threonylcarbamoyl adenosine modification protein YjeE